MADHSLQNASLSYEGRLNQDLRWAMSEGSRHFDEKSAVHTTLERICRRLGEARIPYAVAGGMALFKHGFRRFTEDVHILISRDGLTQVHQELSGRGYTPLFTGRKNLRDAESGVRIEFLLAGGYPGDGKQKPVAFPDPIDVAEPRDDICYVNLPALVELKLASGMTGTDRMKELADVQELIKLLSLPVDFSNRLNPYVQSKYRDLWQAARGATRRYIKLWRNKFPATEANNIDEMIAALQDGASNELRRMKDDGVTLDAGSGTLDDCARLVTTDPEVAKKYDMHDEAEFWDDDEAPDSDE